MSLSQCVKYHINGVGKCSVKIWGQENAKKKGAGCTCCSFISEKVLTFLLTAGIDSRLRSSNTKINRACNSGKRQAGNGINSQDQLLSQSTDDQDDYSWVRYFHIPRLKPVRFLSLFVPIRTKQISSQRSVQQLVTGKISPYFEHAYRFCS